MERLKLTVTAAALVAVLVMVAGGARAGTITSGSLTAEADIVNLGGTVIAAQNFGGTGAATVNGIAHINSNSGYAPINFSGGYGDPAGMSGSLFTLIDGIAGTTDANEPASLTVGGLTVGKDYRFQAYWIVKENFTTRKMNVNLEGDTASISANPNTSEAVLISYDFTAGDTTFTGTFDGSDGVGTGANGWLCGYSLQSPDPPPPGASTAAHWRFEDNVAAGSHTSTSDPAVSDSGPNGNPLWYWNGGWGNYQFSADVPAAAMFKPGSDAGAKSFDPGAMGVGGNGVLFFDRNAYGDDMAFNDSFTLEGYFKTDGDKSGAGRMEILFQSEAQFNYLMNVNEGAAGEVRFAMSKVGGGEYPVARLIDKNYADGDWHYFAAKYTKREGPDAVSLTVMNEDGSRSTAYALTSAGFEPATSTSNLFIGRQWHTAAPYRTFQGKLDELRISGEALTTDALLASLTPTVAHWRFEDNVSPGSHNSAGNDAIADSSGNGNPLWYWNGGWGDYARNSDTPPTWMAPGAAGTNQWSFDPGAMGTGGNGTLFFEVGQFGNDLSFVDDFTVEGCFKTSQGQGIMELIHQGAGQQTYIVRMNEGGPGELRFAMRGMDNAYYWAEMGDPTDPANFADDEWHYFAARYDRRGGQDLISLLVMNEDGSILYDEVLTAAAWEPGFTGANMFIGRTWHLGNPYNTFQGLIDEIRISDAYLSDGQLAQRPDDDIPEPASAILFALGLAGVTAWRRRTSKVRG